MDSIFSDLVSTFPQITIKQNEPLAPYTTLKIGGPADIFIHTKNNQDFTRVLKFLSSNPSALRAPPLDKGGQNITILGNGSNVLISDTGIRGIVIKNSDQSIEIIGSTDKSVSTPQVTVLRQEEDSSKYLDFTKIDYDESTFPKVQVKISSGTMLPQAINYLLDHGVTGLQWFAYIPGTIGGGIWYNLHGGQYHFSQYLTSVEVFDLKTGETKTLNSVDLDWGYDSSPFQNQSNLIIISGTFNLYQGDVARARQTALAWIAQKSKVQPMNSAGSVFQNPNLDQCLPLWGEQKSTGWIIDHELGLKDTIIGGAQIGPQHANIFTNLNHATAQDFFALITLVQTKAKEKFNLTLKPEVKFLGEF